MSLFVVQTLNGLQLGILFFLVAASLLARLTGIVSLRTRGVYFIMITLAFGQMIFFIASSLAPYGGDDGLTIQTRNTIFDRAQKSCRSTLVFLHQRTKSR